MISSHRSYPYEQEVRRRGKGVQGHLLDSDYVPLDTDLLACFKCTGQEGVPKEEVAAAVAAESSTGTWSTVWSELLTDLDFYKGRCYRIEDVPGDKESFYAFIAYPLDLFEEGSITNVLTSWSATFLVSRLCATCVWKTSASRWPSSRPATARRTASWSSATG